MITANWVDALLDQRRFRWVPMGTGESGDLVYRREDGLVFARAVRGARVAALRGERDRLVWLRDTGIACPQVIDWRETDDGVCVVMTCVPGIPASELSERDLLAAWPSIVRQLGMLHALPVEHCPFATEPSGRLEDRVVCHGDARTLHFFVDPTTLQCTGVINLGRLAVGDRYSDFASMLGGDRGSWRSGILFSTLAIARPDRERLDFYR